MKNTEHVVPKRANRSAQRRHTKLGNAQDACSAQVFRLALLLRVPARPDVRPEAPETYRADHSIEDEPRTCPEMLAAVLSRQ